jgi:hypothetical protein
MAAADVQQVDRPGQRDGQRYHRPGGTGERGPDAQEDEGARQEGQRNVNGACPFAGPQEHALGQHDEQDQIHCSAGIENALHGAQPNGPFSWTTAKFSMPATLTQRR